MNLLIVTKQFNKRLTKYVNDPNCEQKLHEKYFQNSSKTFKPRFDK